MCDLRHTANFLVLRYGKQIYLCLFIVAYIDVNDVADPDRI